MSSPRKASPSKRKHAESSPPSISFFTLYKFATRWDLFLIAVALLASVLAGALLPVSILLMANIFQSMILFARQRDGEGFLQDVQQFATFNALFATVQFLGSYFGTALINIAAINQVYKIKQEYLRAALNQDMAYFDLQRTGDFAAKMADDILKLEEGIGDKFSTVLYNVSACVACFGMAFAKGWRLAFMCLIAMPVSFLLVGGSGMIANRLSKKESVETGRASAIAEEVLSSIRTVYAFGGQQKECDRYERPVVRARNIKINKELFLGLSSGLLLLAIFCVYAASLYIGVYFIIHDPDNYNADVMFSVFFGVLTGTTSFATVGSLMESLGHARGAGAQIFSLINNEPTINPLLDRGVKPGQMEGSIVFKNVNFHYPSRPDVPILKNVSLTIESGQSVALVGESGSGKSTVVQLICRYYDVTDGSVCVDGYDVRELSVRWLRSQIGLVGQEPVLFNASIRDNIRHGCAPATEAEIQAAAKQANADHFIVNLPKKYDTTVGDRGASLSGGQKQRIAIARALVQNPRVLLLDEATSALDTASEAKVQAALDKASKDRTTLIVAHRLSTIRNVNVIHVFKSGQIVETGNHIELMAKKGVYYQMVNLQGPVETDSHDSYTEVELAKEDSAISKISRNYKLADQEGETISEVTEDAKSRTAPSLSFWGVVAMNKPEWKLITVASICSIVNGFGMPLFAVVFGDLFGAMSSTDPEILLENAKRSAINFIIIGLLAGASGFIQSFLFGAAGGFLTARLRLAMFSQLLRQELAFFDDRANSTGALCARLSAEAAYVQGATGQRIGTILQAVGGFGMALVIAMSYEWRVGLVYTSFIPFIMAVFYWEGRMTNAESQSTASTMENSTKLAMEAVSNIRTVASLGREQQVVQEFAGRLWPSLAVCRRSAHARGLVNALSKCMFPLINTVSLFYGGHLIVYNGVPYSNILVAVQALQVASTQCSSAFVFAHDVQKGMNAASRIMILLKKQPQILDPENPMATGIEMKGTASFNSVKFRYPTRPAVQVLRDFNLEIESGKTYALVGSSGCGKSTCIQLLERYYDPDSGMLALEGFPIKRLLVSEVRGALGLVSQEPVLFDLSLRENIAYGDNTRTPTLEEVIEAAKLANIHSFVTSLPMGYDTNLGSKGTQLSGGQKQRVAIARALLRKPRILLLDEATSALDTESEKVVQDALDKAKAGRTCVIIAHRLSTVRDADVICVVQGGRVAESGAHADLMAAKRLYYNLHHLAVNK